MPIDRLPVEVIGEIIRGGEAACREAGIPIAGGHTIGAFDQAAVIGEMTAGPAELTVRA